MTVAPELIARVLRVRVQALHRGHGPTGTDHVLLGRTLIALVRQGRTLIVLVRQGRALIAPGPKGQALIGRAHQDRVTQATSVRRVRVSIVNGRIGVGIAMGLDGHDRTASGRTSGSFRRSGDCRSEMQEEARDKPGPFFFADGLQDA